MFKLQHKLSLGFGGLLLIILIIGGQSILTLTRLGSSIDVILRENYRSVVACQTMKESLERMDSGLLFVLLGEGRRGADLIRTNEMIFADALQAELNNITLPDEGPKARELRDLFVRYRENLDGVLGATVVAGQARAAYFDRILPLFVNIKETADAILRMNQQNMNDQNDRARHSAAVARRQMYGLLAGGLILAVLFLGFVRRWILSPVRRLITSAEEIKKGNLELVVQGHSHDEIGLLSETFNEMAAALRQTRRIDQIKLARVQRATEQAFKNLPEAVAILDPEGQVDVATEAAQSSFGLRPRQTLRDLPYRWMRDVFNGALHTLRPATLKEEGGLIQHFVGGGERYIRPEAVPILDQESKPTGIILILKDVTQEREQEELKRGLIATVSHQLISPLTSIRMALHLLLEENIGSLNPKQAELLAAARDDSIRLHSMLNNLLDISRMEAGKAKQSYRDVSPALVVFEALEPFQAKARDQGITLRSAVPEDLPDVWADPAQIQAVFSNLLTNALRFTSAGGKIDVRASADESFVSFAVTDTGKGIPQQYLGQVFERFFQVPGPDAETGVGLGLAIVKEIVESHGGTVRVDSRVGEGSTFIFTLRRADHVSDKAGRP
jgi:signal transduction histidine kinase/HAMP domain-containing protein